MRRRTAPFILLALAPLAGAPLAGQSPAAAPGDAQVTGTVFDSLAGAPLEGALVQLVTSGASRDVVRSVRSGPGGAFALAHVPEGRYQLGFLHPLLDSLGLANPVREVAVPGGGRVRADLATPSAPRLRLALCGGAPGAPPAVQVGTVRRADDLSPVRGAVLAGRWGEYAIRRGEIGQRVAGVTDTTGADGRYLFCDVPKGGSVLLRVGSTAGTSAVIDVDIPANGLGRRDIYLGEARPEAVTVAALEGAPADSARLEIEVGDGVLRGRVVDRESARPIAGARVGLVGGREVRSDRSGEWTLGGIATGTRVLEVRAVGYAARRMAVDVIAGAPAIEVGLAHRGALLDTVRVTASRIRLEKTGFEERARRNVGRFITTEDMLRRPIIFTSQVFHTMPGMRVDRTMLGDTRISMRGPWGRCSPAIYIDGHHMRDLSAEDIDTFVSPDEVAGIEVYGDAFVPAEFNPGLMGCGSIVIWRKAGENPARFWSYRRRTLHGLIAVALGFGIGAFISANR